MAEENKLGDRKREDSKEDQLSLSRGQCKGLLELFPAPT